MKFSTPISRQFLHSLPLFIAFSVAALWVSVGQLQNSTVALFLGVISGGLVDMDHRITGRLKNLLAILLAFSGSAMVVQLSLHNPLLLLFVMTFLAFAMTFLAAVDGRYKIVGFVSLLVALYTLLTHQPNLAWYINPLMILLGAFICQTVIMLFYLIFPNHPVQQSLADSYLAVGDYFQCKARFFSPDDYDEFEQTEYDLARATAVVTTAFNATRDILFNRLAGRQIPKRRQLQLNEFFLAQDLHEKVSAAHVDYQQLLQTFTHSDILFRIERLMNMQGRVCKQYAKALAEEKHFVIPAWLNRADAGLQKAWQHYILKDQQSDDWLGVGQMIDNLHKLTQSIQTLGQGEVSDFADVSLQNTQVQHTREILQRLKQHLTPESAYFRHASRMAAISFTSIVIAQLFELSLGYWILLTAVLVCQPNAAATKARLIQRIVGTLSGVLVGAVLPYLAPDRISLLALLVISSTCFFYFRLKHVSFSTFFVTIQVFLSFSFIGINTLDIMWPRFFDTVIGSLMAWLYVRYIYPEKRYQSPNQLIQKALSNNALYLDLIVKQLRFGAKDDIDYRIARRRVHESASALAATAEELNQTAITQSVQLNYRIISQLSTLAAKRHLPEGKKADEIILPKDFEAWAKALSQRMKALPTNAPSLERNGLPKPLLTEIDKKSELLCRPLQRIDELLNKIEEKK